MHLSLAAFLSLEWREAVVVDLGNQRINDDDVLRIANRLDQYAHLEQLFLGLNPITQVGVSALALAIPRAPKLFYVGVSGFTFHIDPGISCSWLPAPRPQPSSSFIIMREELEGGHNKISTESVYQNENWIHFLYEEAERSPVRGKGGVSADGAAE